MFIINPFKANFSFLCEMLYATWYDLHPWRSVTFSKVAGFWPETSLKVNSSMGVFHVFQIVKMVPNRAAHDISSANIRKDKKVG